LLQFVSAPTLSTELTPTAQKAIQLRVVNAIKKWIEEQYDDFTESMKRVLHDWIGHMAITQKNHADALTASLRKVGGPFKSLGSSI